MDAIARHLGRDRAAVREINFIRPDEMPYDQGLIFQDGKPLIYDSGDFAASLDKLRKLVGWDDFEAFREQARAQGRRVGIGLACYVEGTGVGPYEGGHVQVHTTGKVTVATGLTTQGQGHQTSFAQIVADELGVSMADIEVTTGDTRRLAYAVGTFAIPCGGDERFGHRDGGAHGPGQGVGHRGRRSGGRVGDLEIVDGAVQVKGAPDVRLGLGTIAVLSNPLRYAFDEASSAATQFAVGDPDNAPLGAGDEPGLEGREYYSPARSTFANGMHAVIVETDPDTAEIRIAALLRGARLRPADQPAHRRGPDPRRRRAGRRRRALRADGLRRARPAAQRVVHGLPDAIRQRGPERDRDRPPGDRHRRSTRWGSRAPARPG